MKIYKITEASKYLGISINSLKTLANNGKLNSFKTSGEHRRFREDDLDAYMGVKKEKQERLTVCKKCGRKSSVVDMSNCPFCRKMLCVRKNCRSRTRIFPAK